MINKIKISIFGNPDLEFDSLPIKLLPRLQKKFPKINWQIEDPNELDLPNSDQWIIIDTVKNLPEVKILDIDKISKPQCRMTAHDFDLNTHLQLVQKLNKNIDIKIIGVPMYYDKQKALTEITKIIFDLLK